VRGRLQVLTPGSLGGLSLYPQGKLTLSLAAGLLTLKLSPQTPILCHQTSRVADIYRRDIL
jgi:hypothetical protein